LQLGIEKKILMPFLLLVIVPVLTVGIVSYKGSYDYLVKTEKENAAKELENVESALNAYYQRGMDQEFSPGELSPETSDFFKEEKLDNFLVTDEQGKTIYNSTELRELPTLPLQEIKTVREGQINLEGTLTAKRVMLYRYVASRRLVLYKLVEMSYFAPLLLEIQKYTILVALIGVILATELTIIIAYSLSKPIKRLADVCRKIGKGEFHQDIEIKSKDEIGVLADSIRDMSIKLHEKNKQLIEMKQLNEEILRHTTTGILTTDCRGELLSINAAAEEILGSSENSSGLILQELLGLCRRTLETGKPLQVTRQVTDGDEYRYIETSTALFENVTGGKGVVCSFHDVTKKRKIEKRIETINRLASLGGMAAGLAHEIRNPLAGIKTSSQVLAARLEREEQKRLINGILKEINRLDKLVTDLLSFARTSPSRISAVDLQEVVYSAKILVDKQLAKKNIRFIFDAPSVIPAVKVDKDHLQQIFLNLFLNSIKFVPEGGFIKVIARQSLDGKSVSVRVVDNGTGIPPEHIPKIFNPFFSTDPVGTGLGLSVVQKLIAENGGSIDVASKPGETVFTLQLPLLERGKKHVEDNINHR